MRKAVIPAVLILAACATNPPEPPELGVEIPRAWTAAPEASALETPAEVTPWWEELGDPALEKLIPQALSVNHDLAAAAARVAEAEALARIVGADLYPQIGADVTAQRSKRNFIGFPIPGQEGGVLSTTTTTHGLNLNISWEADLWGRLRAGKQAAVAGYQAARVDLVGARLSLAGQTAKAWFSLVEAAEQVRLAREVLASRERSEKWIDRRYRLGTRPALDLRFARVNRASAEASLASWERLFDASRRQLALILARYPGGEAPAELAEAALPELPGPAPAGLPAELVTRRPDLAAAELRLAASGLEVEAARRALYPTLRLTGSAGTLSGEVGDLLESDFSVWSLAGGLLQPVFQGGRLRAGVDLSRARYEAAAEGYVQAVLRAFGEVETTLAAEGFLERQLGALEDAAEQSVAAQALAEDRYAAGLADFLSVLEAQREAALAQSRAITLHRQLLDARVDLHLALGGELAAEPLPAALPSPTATTAQALPEPITEAPGQ